MKFLFYGNAGNTGFRITSWLRQKGLEGILYIPQKQIRHVRNQPEWENPKLADNYPEWIQLVPKGFHYYHFSILNKKVKQYASNCDVVLTTGIEVVNVLTIEKPVVFIPDGGDITDYPFHSKSLKAELFSYFYRKRIRKIGRIITAQENCIWAANLLGVSDRVEVFSLPVDMDAINSNLNRKLLKNLSQRYSTYDWIFFHPTRKSLDPTRSDYKGNEKFIYAFAEFIHSHPSTKVKLIDGLHGADREQYLRLVKQLNLSKYCESVEHLSLPDLHAYMAFEKCIVFDQFGPLGRHSFGGVAREAICLGSPLVTATDTKLAKFESAYGPNSPIFSAFEKDEILKAMENLTSFSSDEFEALRQSTLDWAKRYLHWENRIDEFIAILEDVVRQNRDS